MEPQDYTDFHKKCHCDCGANGATRSNLNPFRLITFLCVLCVSAVQIHATTFTGRFTTSAYTYEDTTENFLRGFQTARIEVKDIGDSRFSFHTYLRGTTDLLTEGPSDPKADILNGFLRYKGNDFTVKAGRQQIFEGVGIGTIDGANVRVQVSDLFRSAVYVGTESPLNESFELTSWDEGNVMGVHVESDKIPKTDIGVSYVRKERNEKLYEEIMGTDLRKKISDRIHVYGRLDWDFIQKEMRRIEGVARVSPTKDLNLTGEYIRRTPRVSPRFLFKIFPLNTNFEAGLSGTYRVSSLLSFKGRYALVHYDFDDDNSHRIDVGLNIKDGSFGYTRRMGYGGEKDGVYVGCFHSFSNDIWVRARVEYATYALIEEAAEKDDILTSNVGINYRPAKQISFTLEGQGFTNKLYDNDIRVLFRADYWIFRR
jgi:hypothetical protein